MSAAIHSYGATLSVASAVGGTYVAIGEVVKITPPEVVVGSTKVTHLQSPSAAHEKIPGLVDAGKLTFMINFVKTQFATLHGYAVARATKGWKVTAADGSVWECGGFITNVKPEVPEDDRLTIEFTVELTGLPSFTAG